MMLKKISDIIDIKHIIFTYGYKIQYTRYVLYSVYKIKQIHFLTSCLTNFTGFAMNALSIIYSYTMHSVVL